MEENTFYDIHMHAFNLSHPDFRAFISRFRMDVYKMDLLLIIAGFISFIALFPIFRRFIKSITDRILNKISNLLSVMENDTGSLFLLTEDCAREDKNPLLDDSGLHIGGKAYKRMVLTPLMMDFGRKGSKDNLRIHYQKPSEKPIVEQVIDVFNGIRKYKNANSSSDLREKYPYLTQNTNRIIEIYPFLGLATKNYDMPRIKKMLDKYFGEYAGSRTDLANNMGKFDGNIENIGSNFFAGIKVYPPLGFDPWPDNKEELEKVSHLYSYCCKKDIPITCHGSKGGFVVVKKRELRNYTRISKWEEVMRHFPELKLNLAHLPMREKILMIFPNLKHPRLKAMLRIVLNNENVYVDFSNRAINDKYYKSLRKVIDNLPAEQKTKLTERILFGSDFTVNLMSIESYNKYLDIFSKTGYLTPEEKDSFCCVNPERFLFS